MLIRTDGHSLFDNDSAQASALETDVMRFLAILGFCLMVVFALVQSLPVSSVSSAITEAESHKDKYRYDVLKQQNDALQLIVKVQSLSQQFNDKKHLLSQVNQRLSEQMMQLFEVEQLLQSQSKKLEELVSINNLVEKVLTSAKITQDEAERQVDELLKAPVANNRVHEKVSPKSTSGFQLSFSSNLIFRKLVLERKVTLYIKTGEQYLTYMQGKFRSDKVSGRLYEMMNHTVPLEFVSLLGGSTAAADATWYVSLPESTETEIGALMSRHDSGLIEIGRQGQVSFRRE